MKVNISGIKIDQIDLNQSVDKINSLLASKKQHYVVTVNPEFIVEASKDEDFERVLNEASLAICDGFGLVLVSGGKLKRVTGVDLSQKLLKDEKNKIFLLGGNEGSAKKLLTEYSQSVVGAERGGKINENNWLLSNNDKMIAKINESGASILLVGFGQIKQEMWITNNLSKMPKVKVAIGVGGTFDYLSGSIKRAPKLIRVIGLEWLYRLITQPTRIPRIFNATFKFLWLVIFRR